MPFEKLPATDGCEHTGLRTLLLAAFLLSIALLFAGISIYLTPAAEAGTVIADVMESEAVHAFLGIETGA